MALHLLYSDDFTGYANDAAFKAAYPYDPPSDTSSTASSDVTWSSTNGPDSQPGMRRTSGSGLFGFDKFPLAPQGKRFRVSGRWKLASPESGALAKVWWSPSGDRASDFAGNVIIVTGNYTGSLTFSVKTTASYSNTGGHVYFETDAAAFTAGAAFDMVIDGRISTITEVSPGVFAPSTDGYLTVSIDAVEKFSFVGPVWLNDADLNDYPGYWNGVSINGGRFTNLAISDEIPSIRGSFVAGESGTVTANRAALFSLNGSANTNSTEGLFKIAGDLEVTGTTSIASGSLALDDLSDVAIVSPATFQVLAYSGSAWVNTNAVGQIITSTVTLTDAQIKALPTTGIQTLATSGAGFRYDLAWAMLDLDSTAGAYTNISTAADLEIMFGVAGAWASHPIYNDTTIRTPIYTNTALSSFLGSAGRQLVKLLGVGYAEVWNDSNGFLAYPNGIASFENKSLIVSMTNPAGNLTGGNAANTLKVTCYYMKETV